MNLLLIVLASLLSCAGQLCQKQATLQNCRRGLYGWLAVSIILLGIALLVWLRVLQTVPVGVAYPMLSLNFIFVSLAARWLWKETIPWRHALGIALIVGGVAVMGSYT
ncbi:4-amino-4-deoxy-L-arabinose-phosphoundecaprenol flippase subunit ArnE [Erwinia persicina]|uniref:4-amino-4-deoxy-L-arabinose-phosphoundecaprenol flippase subunit ArnE n=1 Tax=Erwinia persicina TaxID=55211 RepID=A0A3S7S626_9GAMM|nr:4-amino-4-deoxy-L-arabinose-phosphoundecaprenol flippase subunit ArnE [Erwinia persicina]AXU96018.1 4-amino-4-deoxy-L-arabinose-phospho-UDP flippase [Erwinia persicina]MBC3946792.1 4-amino-4-deoxy-L-arabinose-phosphoundecaprenol flippase subunit ArnE [Erwinia persicina]MBD8106527.1 4-amino-4-deoxy-L-arabinose-phosphoundecaprenol flippase subunit ArnE [Erwinia persicina]MBD8209100.1 4-amino-4-deoxy-L-arabinose-phosphoundecaprenol flippase subunit ArnE [Erwinia persicina]MCQ4094475.1 4-amino-